MMCLKPLWGGEGGLEVREECGQLSPESEHAFLLLALIPGGAGLRTKHVRVVILAGGFAPPTPKDQKDRHGVFVTTEYKHHVGFWTPLGLGLSD